MRFNGFQKTRLLICLIWWLALPFSAGCQWAGPGNTGWRCKKNSDCKDDLGCRRYYQPSKKKFIHLCAKKKARMTNRSVYGWVQVVSFWLFVPGLPLFVVISILVSRSRQKKEKHAPSPPSPPSEPSEHV